jgi:hypothetical protein
VSSSSAHRPPHALDDEDRVAFLHATGFDSWQSTDTPWSRRGVERAADAIAHGLLSAPLAVGADGGNGREREFARFELLTGLRTLQLDRP